MEALLSSNPQSDVLVGPLKFGLDPQGSYVQGSRESTTFSNVNSASPAGVKTITINVGSSSEWLDSSTVLLSFLITNNDTTNALLNQTLEVVPWKEAVACPWPWLCPWPHDHVTCHDSRAMNHGECHMFWNQWVSRIDAKMPHRSLTRSAGGRRTPCSVSWRASE